MKTKEAMLDYPVNSLIVSPEARAVFSELVPVYLQRFKIYDMSEHVKGGEDELVEDRSSGNHLHWYIFVQEIEESLGLVKGSIKRQIKKVTVEEDVEANFLKVRQKATPGPCKMITCSAAKIAISVGKSSKYVAFRSSYSIFDRSRLPSVDLPPSFEPALHGGWTQTRTPSYPDSVVLDDCPPQFVDYYADCGVHGLLPPSPHLEIVQAMMKVEMFRMMKEAYDLGRRQGVAATVLSMEASQSAIFVPQQRTKNPQSDHAISPASKKPRHATTYGRKK